MNSKNVLIRAQMAMLMLVAVLSFSVFAASEKGQANAAKTPHAAIEKVTNDMMDVIKAGEKALEQDPQSYFSEIRATLEPVVSFEFIARSVMAKYWGQADASQREKFVETFTEGMVETLGKGMANYSDLTINTLPPKADTSSAKRVEVLQEVDAADGTSRISYTMAKNGAGEWKLINVVLNGVNLGKSYRDQFIQAVKQNDGDLDKVIEKWSAQS